MESAGQENGTPTETRKDYQHPSFWDRPFEGLHSDKVTSVLAPCVFYIFVGSVDFCDHIRFGVFCKPWFISTKMDSSTTASLTNSQPAEHIPYPKRILHSKRSFHRAGSIDSPAYDASEEDNDPTTDDGTSSVISVPVSHQKSRAVGSHSNPLKMQNKKHQQVIDDEDPGVDSPTYDGDVESYTTAGPQHNSQRESAASLRHSHSSSESTVSTLTSPLSRPAGLHPDSSHRPPTSSPLTRNETTPVPPKPSSEENFDPAKITPEEIQKWVRDVIAGHSEGAPASRRYTINPPPTDRPIVIYADGTSGRLEGSLHWAYA